jgi:hypothetical protein
MGEKEKRVPKLHEVLAVEGDLEGTFKAIVDETFVTFSKKPDHFKGHKKTLKMHEERRAHEEEGAGEVKEIVTTVGKKLDYAKESAVRYFDALLQKQATNQNAKADLIVDGEILAEGLPAQFLLDLENKMKLVRAYYQHIPTHDPSVNWVPDETMPKGVFKAESPVLSQKTEKSFKFKVLYEATDKHPAQIEKWNDNVVVGTFTTQKWSGMITPAKKSELLERIDKLIRAAKKARQRANREDVVKEKIGGKIFNYILKD